MVQINFPNLCRCNHSRAVHSQSSTDTGVIREDFYKFENNYDLHCSTHCDLKQ